MDFHIIHHNHNVADLNASLAFYEKALGMKECRRKEAADGSFIIVYMADDSLSFELELTWLRDIRRNMTSANVNSILPSGQTILTPRTRCTARWTASALKTPRWAFILSKTLTATGWRSSLQNEHLNRLCHAVKPNIRINTNI